ncbi:MAG: ferredoxin [Chitinophagaceae bacterium]|nr:ferredoxin [Chitinophagaceae bacterium]
MALKITEDCINCTACESECPNNAIYAPGVKWSLAEGTGVRGKFTLKDGTVIQAEERFAAFSNNNYYVVSAKCTECQGFHEEPQCVSVCPVDCCVSDENFVETAVQLVTKKELLHP